MYVLTHEYVYVRMNMYGICSENIEKEFEFTQREKWKL